jgi:hypothetical protein
MDKNLMGVFAPITTPFDSKGEVAYDKTPGKHGVLCQFETKRISCSWL